MHIEEFLTLLGRHQKNFSERGDIVSEIKNLGKN